MKSYRPVFGTIFIGLIALLIGAGARLSAFGHNFFFNVSFSFTWVVVGLLVVSALLLLTAALWPRHEPETPGYLRSSHSCARTSTTTTPPPSSQEDGVSSLFDANASATPNADTRTEEFPRTAAYGTAAYGTSATTAERRFVPVTDDEARKGASSSGGNVLADLRWLEPTGEQVTIPLYAKEGSIDLLINADSPVAITLGMGTGRVTVDPTLGLHRLGEEPLSAPELVGTELLLGRPISDASEAHMVIEIESPAADLRISAI